jgi:hypothetical protein
MEKILEKIWIDILDIQHIDIEDDFFDLGATSLHIILFINTLQNVTGKPIGFDVLQDGTTIKNVAIRMTLVE